MKSGMSSKLLLALMLAVAMSACSSINNNLSHAPWPDGAPALGYFQETYQQDKDNQSLQEQGDYLLWIRRFYEGFQVVPGWLEITKTVVKELPISESELAEDRLHVLGQRISGEWAKDNSVRLIDSRMANVWRDSLMEAHDQGDVLTFLLALEEDVTALLENSLAGDEIYFERYYEDPFDF